MSRHVEGFRASRALLIGIDRYTSGIPALRTPVADATRVAQALTVDHGFGCQLITDDDATLEKLCQALSALASSVHEDDRVLFYFAGHGVALDNSDGPTGYLLPQDATRDNTDLYMPMVELDRLLSALPCRHMLVILDCCFAGAFRWAGGRDLIIAPQNLHRERYAWFVRDAAWQAIASSAHDQRALDVVAGETLGERGEHERHSPFAKALLDGLAGAADLPGSSGTGDGVITATELFLYIEEQLMNSSGTHRLRQSPILWPLTKHAKGQFVFLTPGKELDLPPAPRLDAEANPWRGLKPYGIEHSELFFGRRIATNRLVDRVLSGSLVVVTGPSGSGKSSLVRAGLVPRLADRMHPVVVRPGTTPFASLASALGHGGGPDSPDESDLVSNALALAAWIEKQSRDTLLVIDQAEELITMCRTDYIVKRYLEQIENALALGEKLRIVITVRAEFEPQFIQSSLKARWLHARFFVPPMTQDELRRVIEGPATVKVVQFESTELVDELVNEVVQMPGALPLLSFTLSEMYARYVSEHAMDRTLTRRHYESLEGGVTGSLRVLADRVIEDMDGPHRRTARRLLERLVSVQSGEFARRRVPRDELLADDLDEASRSDGVLALLVNARLVVTDTVGDEAHLELAHDALIFGWPQLLGWVRDDAERIVALRRLTLDAVQWEKSGRKVTDLLWADAARSAIAEDLLSTEYPGLSGVENAFARSSLDHARKVRRVRSAMLAGATTLTLLITLVASLYGIGVRQAKIDQLLSSASSLQNSGELIKANASALSAFEMSQDWPLLWGNRRTRAEGLLNSLMNTGVPYVYARLETVFSVSISEQGTFVATVSRRHADKVGENTLSIGPPNIPRKIAKGPYLNAVFRPGGSELYAASVRDDRVLIEMINAKSGTAVRRYPLLEFQPPDRRSVADVPRQERLNAVVVDHMDFSGDGRVLILAGWAAIDKQGVLLRPWRAYLDVASGSVGQFVGPDLKYDLPPAVAEQKIAANENVTRVASAGASEIYVDTTDPPRRTIVGSIGGRGVTTVAISPSGKAVAAGGDGGTVLMFQEAEDGTWSSTELPLPGDADVKALQFCSEDIIAASRADHTISLAWSKDEGGHKVAHSRSLRGHTDNIREMIVDRKSKRIFTAGDDLQIRLWGYETGERRVLRGSERPVGGLALSHSGDWLLSWDAGGNVLTWRLSDGVSLAFRNNVRTNAAFEDALPIDNYLGAGDSGGLRAYVARMDSGMVRHLDVTADGLVAVGYYGGPIILWGPEPGRTQEINVREGQFQFFEAGKYLVAGKQVFSASDKYSRGYATSVPAIMNGDKWFTVEHGIPQLVSLQATNDQSKAVEAELDEEEERHLSPDGRWFVSLDERRYCFWERPFQTAGKCGRLPSPWNVQRGPVTFSPHGDRMLTIVSGNNGRRLAEIDLRGEEMTLFDSGELAGSFQVTEDGSLIAAAGRYGELYLAAFGDAKLREVGRHSRQILSLAFSPDGRWLATGGLDRTARIWSTSTLESTSYEFLDPVETIVFDNRNQRWLAASGGSVFAIPLLEGDRAKATFRGERLSNATPDPADRLANLLRPLEAEALR